MGTRKRVSSMRYSERRVSYSIPERNNSMPNPIKRIVLTPSLAAEKQLILDQIRDDPRRPRISERKVDLPKTKAAAPKPKKK